ncbi:ADP-heptose:LPS heptosyltransferase [Xanthomonas arboricola]
MCIQLLGDYELCKPYIHACFDQWRRENLRTVLVCNAAWKELVAEDLHPDQIIAVDVYKLTHDLRYRVAMLRDLRRLQACIAMCAAHPRDGVVHDACMKSVAAPRSFCYQDEYPDRVMIDGRMARRHYTNVVSCPSDIHRAERHALLLTAAGISPPGEPIALPMGKVHFKNPKAPYLVISPGASRSEKTWPLSRFVAIANRAMSEYPDLSCVLVGSPAEAVWIDAMCAELGERAMSLAGRNSLSELQACVRDSVAVLGNDSAAIHIAAACRVPSVVAMNGATYGHCLPYSHRSNPVFPIAPVMAVELMPCFRCDWNCKFPTADGAPFPCLDALKVEQVWEKLNPILARRQ